MIKIYRYKKSDSLIKEKAIQDLVNGRKCFGLDWMGIIIPEWFLVQRLLTGLEDRYEKEMNLREKMSLAEKCADTYSYLNRNEQSKNYYLKQVNTNSRKQKFSMVFSWNMHRN